MPSKLPALLAVASLACLHHTAGAQSLVGAMVPDPGSSGTDLIVIDPSTGTHDFYMRVPHDTSGSRVLYHLTSLPGCKLAGSLIRDITSANVSSQLVTIDPLTSSVNVLSYGSPVGTSYSEGMEYSPRHGAILIGFAALGNFGTNRLALINPDTGAVISSTGAISGVTDIDYILSTDTDDVVIDFNASSASARVKHLTSLMPNPVLASFASPPSLINYWDGARHPTTGEIIFTDSGGKRLVRLVGNTYSNGATLADDVAIRGLAWANLPPKSIMPAYAGACPGSPATISAHAVGTPPFTYKWRRNGIEIDSSLNPSALTKDLSLGASGPALEADYDCIISNDCGSHTTASVPFILCRADFDCDGLVDDTDFIGFVVGYNILDCADPAMPAGCPADLNADGVVDDSDFTLFVQAYNRLLCGE